MPQRLPCCASFRPASLICIKRAFSPVDSVVPVVCGRSRGAVPAQEGIMRTSVPGLDGHRRICMGMLVAAAASLLPAMGLAADVALSIRLDAEFVELVRGMRRAEGLDPPDPSADQRLALLLQRLREAPLDADPAPPAFASSLAVVHDRICVRRS